MRKSLLSLFPFLLLKILPPVLLTVLAWHAGQQRLEGWSGPAGSLTNDLFVPAIMMNAGNGFTNTEPAEIPDLRAFLDFQAPKFDCRLLDDEVKRIPLHPFQEYHRYLIYSVAAIWRLFGVSWDAMKILIVLFFCMASLCVFGICRLAMNSLISLFAATGFIYAQPVLWTLPIFRDFAKAPFILSLIFLLGITIRRRVSGRVYILLSVLIGMLLGVGMGFRRDMMVFLPVSLFFLLVCRMRPVAHPVVARLLAAGMLVVLFVVSGFPIHKALFRDGYVASHDTIMGLSSYSDHELGILQPASYEKHYLLNDLYCTLKAHDLAKRGVTFPREVYAELCNDSNFDFAMKRAYVMEIFKTFPGDLIARAYAAVLRMSTSIVPAKSSWARHIEERGLWFLIAGLLLIAAKTPVRAWLILIMLCYFCGYTSLQFAFRHAFHMSFVPYFFAGLCLQYLFLGIVVSLPGRFRKRPGFRPFVFNGGFTRAVVRAALWLAVTMALFYGPLALARAWQHSRVLALKNSYQNAPATPIPHRVMVWDGRDIFMPTAGRTCRLCQNMGLIVDIETRHLAASFTDVKEPLDIKLIYEWEGLSWDFSGLATFAIQPGVTPVSLRYFFPVHEVTTCADWNHFVGISLPREQSHLFRGFYQVDNPGALGLLINMGIPDREDLFIADQHLKIPWSGETWRPYRIYDDFQPFLAEMEIKNLLNRSDFEGALALADNALSVRPQSIQFGFLRAEILDKMGQPDAALDACMNLLQFYLDTFVFYARLDRYFQEHGGAPRRLQEWSAVLEQNPALDCARYYLEAARQEMPLKETPVMSGAMDAHSGNP